MLSDWGPVRGSAHMGDNSDTTSPREDRARATFGPDKRQNQMVRKWFPVLCWSQQTARFWRQSTVMMMMMMSINNITQQQWRQPTWTRVTCRWIIFHSWEEQHCSTRRGPFGRLKQTEPAEPASTLAGWIHVLSSVGGPQSSWTQRTKNCFLCL